MKISFVLLLLALPASSNAAFRVLIDPGHGGSDNGAVHSHLREADVVLDISLRLQKLLEATPGIEVSLSRTTDLLVTLPDRVKKAKSAHADLLLSLHANAAPGETAQGLEFFFQNSLPADEDALYLADLENQSATELVTADLSNTRRGDVNAIIEDLHRQARMQSSLKFSEALARQWQGRGIKHLAIKQAPLYVVNHATQPSVLVEVGFLTHPVESKKLAQAAYRNELALHLRDAVLEYRSQIQPLGPRALVGVSL